MNIHKIICFLLVVCFSISSCNYEKKATTETASSIVSKQSISLAISGMTCEIGCAKTIQSKLSKKEGVLNANVVFKDSIANIEFNDRVTSTKELITFIEGIAGGDFYKASETSVKTAI